MHSKQRLKSSQLKSSGGGGRLKPNQNLINGPAVPPLSIQTNPPAVVRTVALLLIQTCWRQEILKKKAPHVMSHGGEEVVDPRSADLWRVSSFPSSTFDL